MKGEFWLICRFLQVKKISVSAEICIRGIREARSASRPVVKGLTDYRQQRKNNMNILDALNAYGVQQKESNAKPLNNPDAAAKTAQTSFTEAIQYTDETAVKQKQTSDIYSKNGMGEEQEAQVSKEEGTEAEQNQERLDNVSGRMTEEDMAELQKEGFSVGEMTVEQL